MNIGLKCKDLYSEFTIAKIDYENKGTTNFALLNYGVTKLLENAENCLQLINDGEKLSDKEFYEILDKFAYVDNWNDEDRYNVIALFYDLKFVGKEIINTTLVRCNPPYEPARAIDLKVLYTEEGIIDSQHKYTIDELRYLIMNKKIVVISEIERDIRHNEKLSKTYEYIDTKPAYDENTKTYEFFNPHGKFYSYTLKYIRDNISVKELLILFKEYLEHINNEIDNVISKKNWKDHLSNMICESYKDEFKKQGYAKRLTNLNNIKNNHYR